MKKRIIIHHSATKDSITVDWNAIDNYHTNTLGYLDIGYHWGVEKVNGKLTIMKGRPEEMDGAHTKQQNMNKIAIGVCVVGNFDQEIPSDDTYQITAQLCADICFRNKISLSGVDAAIDPHSKYAVKTCPGKNFDMAKLKNLTKYFLGLKLKEEEALSQSFKDIKGHWGEKDITEAKAIGLVKGDETGNFYPNNGITRAEVVAIIMRLYRILKG